MNERPFDVGVVVEDYPGYKWPLSAWRNYYYHNVTCTGAITHEQFAKDSPKVLEALQKSDAQERAMMEVLHNPPEAVIEVVRQLVKAQTEAMMTGAMPQAMQGGAPAQPVPPQHAAPPAPPNAQPQPLVPHTHGYNAGAMQTAEANGHMHNVVNGECEECEGHTHAMGDLQGSGVPAQAVPPTLGQTPNPAANAPQK